jgi:hypothetical protein
LNHLTVPVMRAIELILSPAGQSVERQRLASDREKTRFASPEFHVTH